MFDFRSWPFQPVPGRSPGGGASGAETTRRRNAAQLASLLLGVMGLLLLGVTFFLAIILLSLSLHDELSPETIAAANSGWTLVNTLMVASVAGASGAIGLGIWGEVRAYQRRGTRGRRVGIALGCVTLLAWAWPWLRR